MGETGVLAQGGGRHRGPQGPVDGQLPPGTWSPAAGWGRTAPQMTTSPPWGVGRAQGAL